MLSTTCWSLFPGAGPLTQGGLLVGTGARGTKGVLLD